MPGAAAAMRSASSLSAGDRTAPLRTIVPSGAISTVMLDVTCADFRVVIQRHLDFLSDLPVGSHELTSSRAGALATTAGPAT